MNTIQRNVKTRLAFASTVTTLGEDQVEITISTAARARDGNIWEPSGCLLANYRQNPIVLFSHMPEEPVGTASSVRISNIGVVALVTFAQLGISPTADKVRGLVKTGVLSGISAGILPLEVEPIDPNKPRDGVRITSWELLEVSFVSIPADTTAGVTTRALSLTPSLRRDWDRRQASVAALAPGVPPSYAERQAAVAALMPRPPIHRGNDAVYAADMRDYLARRTLMANR